MEQLKTCKKCKQKLPIASFCKRSNQIDGLNYYCRLCDAQNCRKYYQSSKTVRAKALLRSVKWKKDNRDAVLFSNKKYREKHSNQRALYEKKRRRTAIIKNRYRFLQRRYTSLLTDSAVRKIIVHTQKTLKCADIPQELVEAKREHLKLLRAIKEQKHETATNLSAKRSMGNKRRHA